MFYTLEVISTTLDLKICRQKSFKVNSIDISEHKFMPVILFCVDRVSFTSWEVNNAQLLQDSKIIRLLEMQKNHWMSIIYTKWLMTSIIIISQVYITTCTVIGWFSSCCSKIGTACLHALLSNPIQFARDTVTVIIILLTCFSRLLRGICWQWILN